MIQSQVCTSLEEEEIIALHAHVMFEAGKTNNNKIDILLSHCTESCLLTYVDLYDSN